MLFNEPKLLKFSILTSRRPISSISFSALQRAEIAEISVTCALRCGCGQVSVLFNEPKLLKCVDPLIISALGARFSALQRAEIAEISTNDVAALLTWSFSALQRAEIAEMGMRQAMGGERIGFQCSSTSRNC